MRRADEVWVVRILFDLSPEPGNREIDGSRHDVAIEISPHGAQQLVPRHDDIAAVGKIAEQFEFSMRQRNRAPSTRCLFRDEVDGDGPQPDPAGTP